MSKVIIVVIISVARPDVLQPGHFFMRLEFKDKISGQYNNPQEEKRLKKSFYFLGFFIAFVVIFSATLIIVGDSSVNKIPLLGKILGSGEDSVLTGETDDRINILLLGMGGKGHDGAYLTDTMILVSLKPSAKKIAMYSIPRDLVVPVNGRWVKINSINSTAMVKGEDGGAVVAAALSNVFSLDIKYYLRMDFAGFMSIIDELGGIEVEVANILDDYQYPILGQEDNPNYYSRYEHLHVEKGLQIMSGSLALKFARSRHGINGEGSDFARARRQQLVIQAAKYKLFKKDNLLRPAMLSRILDDFNENVSTNIKVFEGLRLWSLFKDIAKTDISNYVIDDAPKGLLYSSIGEDGAFILIPKTGNFKEINYFFENSFAAIGTDSPEVQPISDSPIPEPEYIGVVEVKNGTTIDGLAAKAAFALRQKDFSILKIANATQRDLASTTIYDLSFGKNKEALAVIQSQISGIYVKGLPEELAAELREDVNSGLVQKRPDFVIILGEDYNK